MRCPGCGDAELEPFFAQQRVPLFCNVLHDDAASALAAARGDLRLSVCGACGLVHNVAFDPALVAYSPDYDASLHCSAHFRGFAEGLAARLVADYGLDGKDVVEVGCGDGEFLRLLARGGRNRAVGFDRSFRGEPGAGPKGVVVHREFLVPAERPDLRFDLLVLRHVLEHVAEPAAFLRGLAPVLKDGGSVYVEVPDGLYTLRDLGIWDLIYEHCSYFSAPALRCVLDESGLETTRLCSEFGGQFLCADARRGRGGVAADVAPAEVARLAREFAAAHAHKVAHWQAELARLAARGSRVAVWGAGSKGVTFLNTVPGGASVHAVVDINSRKYGRFVPGTGQPVVAPEQVARLGIDTVLVMNPNYVAEIGERLRALGVDGRLMTV
jgi:SAM-dependent methyltransferase